MIEDKLDKFLGEGKGWATEKDKKRIMKLAKAELIPIVDCQPFLVLSNCEVLSCLVF